MIRSAAGFGGTGALMLFGEPLPNPDAGLPEEGPRQVHPGGALHGRRPAGLCNARPERGAVAMRAE